MDPELRGGSGDILQRHHHLHPLPFEDQLWYLQRLGGDVAVWRSDIHQHRADVVIFVQLVQVARSVSPRLDPWPVFSPGVVVDEQDLLPFLQREPPCVHAGVINPQFDLGLPGSGCTGVEDRHLDRTRDAIDCLTGNY